MALLGIYDDIAKYGKENVSVFSAERLSNFISAESDNQLDIHIHSYGGSVNEGYACFDILKMSGKELRSTVIGSCASISTLFLLAAPLENRSIYSNGRVIIHNPYIPGEAFDENYDAAKLTAIANEMKIEEDRLLETYVSETTTDRETLRALMNAEKELTPQECLKYGFVSKIIYPILNRSQINELLNTNKNNKMENAEIVAKLDKQEGILNKILRKFGLAQTVAMVLTDSTGAELTLEKESGDPAVGDMATPDGTFVMDDGLTVVVLDGVITEVTPKAEEDQEDVTALKAEIESLKQQIADKDAAQAALIEMQVQARVTEATAEAVALTKELKALKSNFKPEPRVDPVIEPKVKRNTIKDRLAQFETK